MNPAKSEAKTIDGPSASAARRARGSRAIAGDTGSVLKILAGGGERARPRARKNGTGARKDWC